MANIRVPPHSLEAEASVLGSLLIDKEAIAEIAGFLRPEHFYKDSHSRIYKAMLSLYEEREPIDLVTVSDKLKKDKSLTKVGGANYLSELANKVPTAAHVEHYAKLVKDEYTKRELISTAGNITEMAFDEGKDISEILDTAERNIFGLSQQHLQRVFIAIKDALAESFDRLDELHKSAGGLRGVPTGFTDFTDVTDSTDSTDSLALLTH